MHNTLSNGLTWEAIGVIVTAVAAVCGVMGTVILAVIWPMSRAGFPSLIQNRNSPMPTKAKRYDPTGGQQRPGRTFGQRPSACKRGYGRRHRRQRLIVFERDKYICQHCGRLCDDSPSALPCDRPHADHIVPLSQGGADSIDNQQTLCGSCHSRKTNQEDGGFGNRAKNG